MHPGEEAARRKWPNLHQDNGRAVGQRANLGPGNGPQVVAAAPQPPPLPSSPTESSPAQHLELGGCQGGSGGGGVGQSAPELPYGQYAPVTFYYLRQSSAPRKWCLAIVSNKYPVHSEHRTKS